MKIYVIGVNYFNNIIDNVKILSLFPFFSFLFFFLSGDKSIYKAYMIKFVVPNFQLSYYGCCLISPTVKIRIATLYLQYEEA